MAKMSISFRNRGRTRGRGRGRTRSRGRGRTRSRGQQRSRGRGRSRSMRGGEYNAGVRGGGSSFDSTAGPMF